MKQLIFSNISGCFSKKSNFESYVDGSISHKHSGTNISVYKNVLNMCRVFWFSPLIMFSLPLLLFGIIKETHDRYQTPSSQNPNLLYSFLLLVHRVFA